MEIIRAGRNRLAETDALSIVIFGDGTSNISALLQKLLLLAPHSVSQGEFIRRAGEVLRAQAHLLYLERQSLPPFTSIHDLASNYRENNGICHPAISSVLLCVVQLLQVFQYAINPPPPF